MRLPSVTQQAVPLHSDPNHPCSPSPVVAQLSVFRRVAPVGLKASPICGRVANCKGHLWFACAPDWRFASDPADFPSPGTPCPGLGFTRSALLFLATPLQLGESGGGTLTRWSAALRGAPQKPGGTRPPGFSFRNLQAKLRVCRSTAWDDSRFRPRSRSTADTSDKAPRHVCFELCRFLIQDTFDRRFERLIDESSDLPHGVFLHPAGRHSGSADADAAGDKGAFRVKGDGVFIDGDAHLVQRSLGVSASQAGA